MATINLNNVINSAQPASVASVKFDKPGELELTSDQARTLLTEIRAQITTGGTVQTGYLSLQRANDGTFSIENRSRFNPNGSKDKAAVLVKDLIKLAYGDAMGTDSRDKLEQSIDTYLAGKSFGQKLGTVSFVKLLNALEVNVHTEGTATAIKGTATADKKSSLQSLLGAGGSLAVDTKSIETGVKTIRGVHGEVAALREVTQGLMSQDTTKAIRAALTQFTAHGDLAAKITAGHKGNQTLQALAGELVREQKALADKLNTDSSARVVTLRPPGQHTDLRGVAELQGQIDGLQALRLELTQGQDSPVLAATLDKIDAALAQARIELGFAESVVELATATQPLLAQGTNTADRISEATTQFSAHTTLLAALGANAENLDHPGLGQSITRLGTRKSDLAARLNTDIQARVDTIRPAAQDVSVAILSGQITDLRALKGAVDGAPSAPAGPVSAETCEKIDNALVGAESMLAGKAAILAQGALELQARTRALMGERVDGSGAASTYAFDAKALRGALQQHQQLAEQIKFLRDLSPVIFATSLASLEQVRNTLTQKINVDAIVATQPPAAAPSRAHTGNPLLQRLVQLQGLQAALASDPSGALTGTTRDQVTAATQTALSMIGQTQVDRLEARLTALQAPTGVSALVEPRTPTLSERSLKLVALNDLLQDLNPFVSQPGTNPDFIGALRNLRTQVRDQNVVELDALKKAIETDFGRDIQTPPTVEHLSQRSEALTQLDRQASRLQSLLSTTQAGDDPVTSNLATLALGSLHLQDAKSWFRPQGDTALSLIADRPDKSRQDLEQQLLTLHNHGLLRIPAFTELLGKVTDTEPGLAWIGELTCGEPAAVNGLLNRPEWDELALHLKRRAADASGTALSQEADASAPGDRRAQRLAHIELDHQIHVSKRALDGLLRAANPDWGFSATTLKEIQGNQAKRALVAQGMQSLVFDTQTVKALVNARDNTQPPLNVEAFNLVLAKTIALQTAGAKPTTESRAQAAHLLRMVLPEAVTTSKTDEEIVGLALDNLSSKSTSDLLVLADQLGALASDIGGRSEQLLGALQAFDTQTDGPRTRAGQLVGRLTQDVVRVGASMAANISASGGEASNAHLLASAFGRELSQVRNNSAANAALNKAVQALGSAGNLEAIDLSAVRQLMVPLVAHGDSGRSRTAGMAALAMGAGTTSGALQYYFNVESSDMRKGDDLIEVGQRIRNNVESHAMDRLFVKEKLFSSGYGDNNDFTDRFDKLQAFLSQSANFGDGGNPAGIRADVVVNMRDGLARLASSEPAQRASAWTEFQQQFAPPAEGQPPGASKNAGRLLRELFVGLKTAVEKQNPAAAGEEVTQMGQRYIALVDIGQRNAEIQQAASGLRSSHAARAAATEAISQLDQAAPAMKKMAMLVMLDQFVSSDMRDMNRYREALLTGHGQSPSVLEVQLQARFQALMPPVQEGVDAQGVDALVHICKGLLASKEDAHLLLKDLEADGSLPAREGPKAHQAPKGMREFLAREALGQRLGDQVARLTSGQAMTVRVGLGGGLSVGIPTPVGVDLTVGFSAEREHSVVIGKDLQGGFTVLCKAGTKTNSSLGIAAFAKTLSAKVDLGASAAGGFELTFETAQAATQFVTRMFTEPGPGTDPLTFMNAAARARVLDEVGMSVGATVTVGGEVEVPGDLLGLSASFEASAQVGADATYTHSTQRTAFESVQTSRVTWGFSAEVSVGAEVTGNVGEVATEFRDALGQRGQALQAQGQAALASVQARAEGVSGQALDAQVASGVQAVQAKDIEKGGDLLSASTQRQQTSERRVVTRHGAVHPDTCIREGFRDSARSQVTVMGQRVLADDPFSKRITELVGGTPLADNPGFQSEVNRLRSMAQGDFELVLQLNLKQAVAVQIGTLRRDGGQGKEVERLLADRSSYELHSLELGYDRLATDASGLSSANTQQGITVGVPESVLPDAKISVKRWSNANLRSTETVVLGPLMRAPVQQGLLMA